MISCARCRNFVRQDSSAGSAAMRRVNWAKSLEEASSRGWPLCSRARSSAAEGIGTSGWPACLAGKAGAEPRSRSETQDQ